MLTTICATRSDTKKKSYLLQYALLHFINKKEMISYSKAVRANSGHLHDKNLEVRKSLTKKNMLL